MRNVLRRLWSRQPECVLADLAEDDWTPPPPSEVGSTNWADWLAEEPPRRPAAPSPERSAAPIMLNLPSTLDRSDDIVGTWAEPAEPANQEEPVAAEPPRNTLGGGRARIRTPMPERRWRDVLTEFAEHLTDEELAIIRKQFDR